MLEMDSRRTAEQRHRERAHVIISLAMIFCLSGITYARNILWKDDISIWSDSANKSPHNVMAFRSLGKAHLSANNIQEAIKYLRIAEQLAPHLAEVHYDLGYAYNSIHQFNDAIQQYRITLDIMPDDFQAHFNLAVVYLTVGRSEQAREEFAAALRIRPGARDAQAFSRYLTSIDKVPPTKQH